VQLHGLTNFQANPIPPSIKINKKIIGTNNNKHLLKTTKKQKPIKLKQNIKAHGVHVHDPQNPNLLRKSLK
jgi:hypothetical protein